MSRKFNNFATSFADSDPSFSWAWKDLVACYLFERPQGGVVRDVVTGQPAFFTAGSGGTKPAWGVDAVGAHVLPSAAGDSYGIILDDHLGLGDKFTPETLSLEAWAELPADSDLDPRLFSKNSSGSGDDHDVMFGIVDSGGGRSYRCRLSTGGSTATFLSSGSISGVGLHHILWVYDGANVALYVDGVSQTLDSTALTGTIDATVGTPIKIGNSAYSGADNPWDAKIYKVAAYARALTAWEARILARDPMRPFVRDLQFALGAPAAVGGGLSIPVAMHNYRNRRVA